MNTPTRSLLLTAALAIVIAACGTNPSTTDEPTPPPSSAPSAPPAASEAPEETPAASPEPIGTLTVADGAAVDGPGIPLAEAMAGDLSQPVLVRGTLFMTAEGQIFLAESLEDASVPTFGDMRLAVENYPTSGPTWDLADAEITGLQEANGILFFEDTKLYGTISS
jgi:hypothetical protein